MAERTADAVEPTLKIIAHHAGVSVAAVSQALNDRGALRPETRARIKTIAAELGYTPNRAAASLRLGRTMSIGFVLNTIDADPDQQRWAQSSTRHLTALVREAAERGFTVTAIPDDRPDLVVGARVDAIYFPDARTPAPVLAEAVRLGAVIVTNDAPLALDRTVAIRTGYEEATEAALTLLADTGAQRIALITAPAGHPTDAIVVDAYLRWCARADRAPTLATGDLDHERGLGLVRQLVDGGADALLTAPGLGVAADLELERLQLVIPRDVQLVTLCAGDCAVHERLGITRVCLHPEAAPRAAMQALVGLLADDEETERTAVLPWELARGSTTRSEGRHQGSATTLAP